MWKEWRAQPEAARPAFVEACLAYMVIDFLALCQGAGPSVFPLSSLRSAAGGRLPLLCLVPAAPKPMPSPARQSHELLGPARLRAAKARAGSMESSRIVLPNAANHAGSECRRRRKGRSVESSARARCASASAAHARPSPPSEYDWSAGIAPCRPRVAGFSAVLPSAQEGALTGAARADGDEPTEGTGQAAGHGAARLAAELLSVCRVQGVSGAPRSSARLHRLRRWQPASLPGWFTGRTVAPLSQIPNHPTDHPTTDRERLSG